jgi:hypothetical protein
LRGPSSNLNGRVVVDLDGNPNRIFDRVRSSEVWHEAQWLRSGHLVEKFVRKRFNRPVDPQRRSISKLEDDSGGSVPLGAKRAPLSSWPVFSASDVFS